MKYLFFLLFLYTGIQKLTAQDKIEAQLYSTSLKDSVKYTLYFPEDWEGWDDASKHPVLYAINYGVITGDYLQAQVSYFRKRRLTMPNSLIVVIDASMKRMGYSYETGNLSAEGLHFVDFLKKELIPSIEKTHNTSTFRTYIGHSFSASFGNYLFLNEPELFKGYIMLAAEKIAEEKPPFHLSNYAKDYYNHQPTFYYAAVGQFDLQRRRNYAKEIQKETGSLDTSKFFFRYDSLSLADHGNILTLAIQFALEHTYQFYTPYSAKDEKDVVKDLQAIHARIDDIYGIEPEKNFTFYNPFAQEAIKNNDKAGLVEVLKYFESNRLKGWNLMQFGQYCLRLQLKEKAKYYLGLAIEKIRHEEMNSNLGPENLLSCYSDLAFGVYEKEPEKGWDYLLKGLTLYQTNNKYLLKDGKVYFDLGKFSAINNYHVKEGLQYLLTYVSDHADTSNLPSYQSRISNDVAYYYIAKNYLQLKQPKKAKPYLIKALALNKENKAADQLLKQIQ
ncbi:alpha/beta hydrolase-fold protein [Pedobacter steynii]|uniref:Esterase n=1 Tax=Pedobacter steynii TaxID=430522 RepID=A0A1D7QKK1_9SPHI|nr:alpha/beta hydrolase-fold protein [Pedobacter steynii]AOM79205.1 hypothetical protein BFS30_19755 [Pedobacter steynii]